MRPFPEVEAGKWLISRDGGEVPVWSPRSDEVFYVSKQKEMMVVPIDTSSNFRAGVPEALFSVDSYRYFMTAPIFDITPDGKRFLMIKPEIRRDLRIVMVQNFLEELHRLLPTKQQ